MTLDPSPADADEDRLRRELQRLGLSPPSFHDETDAPQVDREVLVKLVEGQLRDSAARLVYMLVGRYKGWFDTYVDLRLNHDKQGEAS